MRTWVARGIAMMCADDSGRVQPGLALQDRAVRAALVVDLAMLGRLRFDSDRIWIDTSPTDLPAADALLSYVDSRPDQSMGRVLETAPVDVLDVLVPERIGRSRLARRRAHRVDKEDAVGAKALAREIADSGRADTPETAAVVALASAVCWVEGTNRERLIMQCGGARDLVRDLCGYLDATRERFMMVTTMPIASSSGF